MSCKTLLLLRTEILGLFVNTLTVDDKYSRHNKENFLKQIQIQLSQIPKTFSVFFIAFLKSKSNSEYFEIKGESHSLRISEIIDAERGVY